MNVLEFSFWPVHIEAWHIANDGHLIFNALDVGPQERAAFSEEDHPYETGDTGRVVFFCTPGFEVVPGEKHSKKAVSSVQMQNCGPSPNDRKTT